MKEAAAGLGTSEGADGRLDPRGKRSNRVGIKLCSSAPNRVSHSTPRVPFASKHKTLIATSGPFQSPPTSQMLWRHPTLRNIAGRAPLKAGRTPSSSRLRWGAGKLKGARIPAPGAGNLGEPNLEPEVAASCSAPLREGGNPELLGKRGVDSSPLHAWVWVGRVTPRGGVTHPSRPKTLPTGVLASVL